MTPENQNPTNQDPQYQPLNQSQPEPQTNMQNQAPPVVPEPLISQPTPDVSPQPVVSPTVNKDNNKMMLIIIGAIIGVLLVIGIVVAIVYAVNAGQAKSDKTSPAVSTSSDSGSTPMEVPEGYMRVGESGFGYINIPDTWIKFQEADAAAGSMMQYSDTTGYSVVTVMNYGTKQKYSVWASSLENQLASNSDYSKSTTTVDGRPANKYIQDYTTTAGKILNVYLFEEPNMGTIYVSVEYKPGDSKVADGIINSYRKDK